MVKSLAFVSGKGGVGKTCLAVNSAINLALMGFRVAVWIIKCQHYDGCEGG